MEAMILALATDVTRIRAHEAACVALQLMLVLAWFRRQQLRRVWQGSKCIHIE